MATSCTSRDTKKTKQRNSTSRFSGCQTLTLFVSPMLSPVCAFGISLSLPLTPLISIRTYVCVNMYMNTLYVYIYINIDVCKYICIAYMYIYIYTFKYTYIYTYIGIYTYIWKCIDKYIELMYILLHSCISSIDIHVYLYAVYAYQQNSVTCVFAPQACMR